jgi:benzaldehyde dehydrogenase (NAD)
LSETWKSADVDGKLFSDGWRVGNGGTFEILSPIDGHSVGTVALADASDVERAGKLATQAQVAWAETSFTARGELMLRAADAMEEMRDEVFRLLAVESGSGPIKANSEIEKAIDELRTAAALPSAPQGEVLAHDKNFALSIARRVPVGVVGVISPWNAPLMLAIRSVAPAIALGNAVILKPDVKTAFSGGHVIAAVFEKAGLPANVFHVLPGGPETGEALVTSPHTKMISFTGSTAAGRRVGEVAGGLMKRVVLELGGKNAIIVFEDADIDKAVDAAAKSSFGHQGQICMATGRHLVHESIADEYMAKLTARVDSMRMGDPREKGVQVGPLISELQAERVQAIVDASVSSGATVVRGGTHDGVYFQPTILDGVSVDNPAFQSEIFGPVAPVTRFSSDAEALELAQATTYGLSAAIHTRNVARALEMAGKLRTGMVHINGTTVNDNAQVPMGGMGDSGNGGRYGGHWSVDEFTYWQWVSVAPS